jgi:hypothetical protein
MTKQLSFISRNCEDIREETFEKRTGKDFSEFVN